ncbi:MAG: ABC transporter ATP-binding protein [Reyranella sp.]|uniref:ABC transporter ATP-binding protein n=1 Tax=Reyranella sp. TaxID=1929291 RepID=UPI003D0B9CEC
MPDTVIRAEGLGKRYLIGHRVHREGIFGEVVMRGARNIWRKGIDLLRGQSVIEGDVIEEFWALRDVNFTIRQGEVIGVIGHNGAGKTTLLKILSRIVEPTEGRVEITGRVASLLEVGTGFHPELTGRENIFLNGAILGMSQREVRARMDEIVDFSGIEKFLDTPVKRYSVGMYARLAFAVAAHLETEVLFVDEVLAVGDAEFQARCLNRMSKVANAGRTVLFVSHNMAAVSALTRRALVFRGGVLSFDGPIQDAVAHYAESLSRMSVERDWGRGTNATLLEASLLNEDGHPTDRYEPGAPLRLRVVIETTGMPGMSLDVVLRDEHNLPIAYYSSSIFSAISLPSAAGRYGCTLTLAPYFLASGQYCFDLMTNYNKYHGDHRVDNAVRFTVELCSPDGIPFDFSQSLGQGTHAMRLSGPLQFEPVPEPAGGEKRRG